MEDAERISGPIEGFVVDFHSRRFILFRDRHNSVTGMCNDCTVDNKCITLVDYLREKVSANYHVNIFIESPFVIRDCTTSTTQPKKEYDIIEQLQIHFWKQLSRSKPRSPKGWVHYADIRDIYSDSRFRNGIRVSLSACPTSGSWSVRRMKRCIEEGSHDLPQAIGEVTNHITFILSNAEKLFESFMTTNYDPPYCTSSCESASTDFNDRVERMNQMTTLFNGMRVHRVCKSLLKLDESDRLPIINWCQDKWKKEIVNSSNMFSVWKQQIRWFEATRDMSIYNGIDELPVSISVVLGSIVMDAYLLARAIYHNNSDEVIVYAGAAHITHYIDFFEKNGGRVVNRAMSESCDSERCLVMRK